MRANVLVIDGANQSTLMFINYTILGYDSWESTQRALAVLTVGSADHSVWGLTLTDGKGNRFQLSGFPYTPFVQAGTEGPGTATTTGWLSNGNIRWKIVKVARTGKTGDDYLRESQVAVPVLTK